MAARSVVFSKLYGGLCAFLRKNKQIPTLVNRLVNIDLSDIHRQEELFDLGLNDASDFLTGMRAEPMTR